MLSRYDLWCGDHGFTGSKIKNARIYLASTGTPTYIDPTGRVSASISKVGLGSAISLRRHVAYGWTVVMDNGNN